MLTIVVFSQENQMYSLPSITNLLRRQMLLGNLDMGLLEYLEKPLLLVYKFNELSDIQRDVVIQTVSYQIVAKGDSTILIPKQEPPFLQVYGKYRKSIFDAFKSIDFSVNLLRPCLVDFGIKSGKDTCISLGVFVFKNKFNSLRTSEKERAIQVISELVMPISHKIYKSFLSTNIKYVAITGAYSKRDFSDKYASDKGCTVSCLINLSLFKRVVDLEITEDEFLKSTEIFLSDETEIKKIQL